MALINLGDIKTNVKALGYESDQDSRIVLLANAVQREIVGGHRWRFMLATGTVAAVAGTATYNLPTSPAMSRVESIRLADAGGQYPELEWTEEEDVLTLANSDPSFNVWQSPAVWSMPTETTFLVYPTPVIAGTFTVRYLKQITELSGDSDVPDIPKPYLDIIVFGVAAHLAGRERQFQTRDSFLAQKDALLEDMKAQYGLRQRQSGRRVRESGRYGNVYGSPSIWS